jgi:hypothetical protein
VKRVPAARAIAIGAVLVIAAASPLRAQSAGAQPASRAQAQPARAEQEPAAKPAAGAAEEEPPPRVTEDSAYTLDAGTLRLGLFKFEYSLFDFLSVGTYTVPWGLLAPTIIAKLRFLQVGPLALAVQSGFAYFDSARLRAFYRHPGDAIVTVFPLMAFASLALGDDLALSLGAAYTEVAVDGTLTIDLFDGAGSGVADNVQLTGNVQWRLSRGVALIVTARWLMLQRVAARASATLHPDDFTTVVVNGNVGASAFQVRDAFSVVPGLLFTAGAFNLRVGGGYGNYNVPLVNFVLPRRTLIPDFDLYFQF